jgi:hypothetical protein
MNELAYSGCKAAGVSTYPPQIARNKECLLHCSRFQHRERNPVLSEEAAVARHGYYLLKAFTFSARPPHRRANR